MSTTQDIKNQSINQRVPLAERMRPRTLDEIKGQDLAIGPHSAFGQMIRDPMSAIPCVLFWGPPGVGKTTIARVIASSSNYQCVRLSGVLDGVAELRKVFNDAQELRKQNGTSTLAIVDEIHRFNKLQQDAFLPHIENGTLTIIGMTTENASFRLRNALLSRMRVIELVALCDNTLDEIIGIALLDEQRGLARFGLGIDVDAKKLLCRLSMGDARRALTGLEWAAAKARSESSNCITCDMVKASFGAQPILYDQDGDYRYDCVSAFIKSLRGSDPEAALYYMLRALKGGEDPLFITRRMMIFASEDASCDPRALEVAVCVDRVVERVGMPEAKIPLAQAVMYLSCCAKSNASYLALKEMEEVVENYPDLEIPKRLRNAPTELMKESGNSIGYRYPHDYEGGFVPERYLPKELGDLRVYRPTDRGLDAKIKERLEYYDKLIRAFK